MSQLDAVIQKPLLGLRFRNFQEQEHPHYQG